MGSEQGKTVWIEFILSRSKPGWKEKGVSLVLGHELQTGHDGRLVKPLFFSSSGKLLFLTLAAKVLQPLRSKHIPQKMATALTAAFLCCYRLFFSGTSSEILCTLRRKTPWCSKKWNKKPLTFPWSAGHSVCTHCDDEVNALTAQNSWIQWGKSVPRYSHRHWFNWPDYEGKG